MSPALSGILAMIGATTVWGLSPLYYKMLSHIPPSEVLSHRTLFSMLFFLAVLLVQGRLGTVPTLIRSHFWVLLLAALMISANWFGFIFAVQAGRTVEASLGYYIFPLVAVMIGAVAFRETLNLWQWVAVGLAFLAVATLTYGLAVMPLLSLALAGTFGLYGLLKKRMNAGPVQSVTAEVMILAPVAVAWLAYRYVGQGAALPDQTTFALLAISGPLTAGPLILFSYATKRVRMATIGLVQYLNPTLQFACAVLAFQEPFTGWHSIAFGLIWTGLAIYTWQSLAQDRAARKLARNSATSLGAVK